MRFICVYKSAVVSKKSHSSLHEEAHASLFGSTQSVLSFMERAESKTKIKKISYPILHPHFSQGHVRSTLFLFFILLFFSAGFFVFASSENASKKNVFEDADQDGLSNDEEKLYGTNPYEKDTDEDGYGDGIEVGSGYDPLKAAPGDKIVSGEKNESIALVEEGVGGDNLTEKVTQEIAGVIKGANDGDSSVSMEEVNEMVEKALGSNMEEVVLPEVDTSGIKVKKTPKGEDELKKDVLEYVTVMAYMLASNSPQEFSTEKEAGSIITSLTEESGAALLSGNMEYLDTLAGQGEAILKEAKSIAVPEVMMETHVKALRLATYATELKEELTPNQNDPLGLVAVLSKAQGLIAASQSFSQEILGKLEEYGVGEIPLNL